jgi:nucleotidyltransferase substrate binding protein (TIGR01987 family)
MNDKHLDLRSLRDAVRSLEDGLDVVRNTEWFDAQDAKVRNTLVAGVIQNFEFVYEIGIKMLKRRIEMDAFSPTDVDESNFRDVLRVAGESGLIADVEAWFRYRKMRNITAHTYDHQKAQQVYHDTLVFIDDARALLNQLEQRNA